MQKHKFGVTCLDALSLKSVSVTPEQKKIVHQHFAPRMLHNAQCDPQISPDAKTQVRHNVSQRTFCRIRTSHTEA
jgi:hypothetical protein